MMPRGPPTPLGGAQQVPSSLLRSNSGLLGGQAGEMPSQNVFPSLVSPRNQFNNSMNMLGNVSSLLHQPFGNGGPPSSGPGTSQRGLMDGGAESDMLSCAGTGLAFNPPSSSYNVPQSMGCNNSGPSQGQGQPQFATGQMLSEQQQSQQQHLDLQSFQRNQQPQQFQGMARPNVGPVKMEQQASNEQSSSSSQQQLQGLRNLGPVKLEPQQIQNMRNLGPIKMEPQDSSLFLQQQQNQQQQQLLLSRQSSQAAAAAHLLHQQRLMQMQHQQQQQQQQQLLKAMPQQRSSPVQSQFHPQNLPMRSPVKPLYEPGMCARRVTHYMYQQQHRPEDNNIEFWRTFVAEYFAPNAKKKWCISMYGSGRQNTGVLPQDVWHCEICNRKPGRGFEATVEVLPRLFKIKYESGTLEELLYVDMPREYQNSSGQIVLDYAKAIQESVFEELRVVRDGQLRIVFSPDLKICSWEFCARRHEELIPRRLLIPQVSQLGAAAQKCQAAAQNSSANNNSNNNSNSNSVSELQTNCNMFLASARQLAKALEVPLVNDLGYTKRYVRCLQISEVVNSMKDLIDYSRETGTGPMESLAKFPRRTNPSPGFQGHPQQLEGPTQQQHQQQTMGSISAHESNPAQLATTNGPPNVNNNNAIASVPITSSSSTAVAGLLHQNSINARQQQNSMSGSSSPYAGNNGSTIQMTSAISSSAVPQTQPILSPTMPSSSNNAQQPASHGNNSLQGAAPLSHANSSSVSMHQQQQQPTLSNDDANDSQSSVQKIIKNMMISSSQVGGNNNGMMGGMGGDSKNVNGMLPANSNTMMIGNGNPMMIGNNRALANGNNAHPGNDGGGPAFGNMGSNGFGQPVMNNGGVQGTNSMSVNGRVAMMMTTSHQQQQQSDLGNQLLSGLGAVNGFNNLQFDWKPSP